MIRRFGPPPTVGTRYRLRPGAYAILIGARGLLLTRQVTADVDEVQLPGGGIDPGESPVPALVREVLEETGHRCRIDRRLGAYRRFTWMPEYGIHAEKLCHVYLGRAGPAWGPAREVGHSAVWTSPARGVDLLASVGDAAMLRAWLRQG